MQKDARSELYPQRVAVSITGTMYVCFMQNFGPRRVLHSSTEVWPPTNMINIDHRLHHAREAGAGGQQAGSQGLAYKFMPSPSRNGGSLADALAISCQFLLPAAARIVGIQSAA